MFPATTEETVEDAWRRACKAYAQVGVDAEAALARALETPVSLHCWQGDDVSGFEVREGPVDGGGLGGAGAALRAGRIVRAGLTEFAPGTGPHHVSRGYFEGYGRNWTGNGLIQWYSTVRL